MNSCGGPLWNGNCRTDGPPVHPEDQEREVLTLKKMKEPLGLSYKRKSPAFEIEDFPLLRIDCGVAWRAGRKKAG